ncbi:MAG: 50S ribosomal protein L25 [Patescibacteria group bacterium]
MTDKINLTASVRTVVGKKVKRSRSKGLVPAVVYGQGIDSMPIFIDGKEYKKVYQQAGTSTLVDLTVDDNKPIKVLLHTPQYHNLLNEPIHADLYAVNMSKKIETAIPIHFIGTSPAVEELEGNFITNRDELDIKCLPSDLIPAVEVDISVIKTFEDQIHVRDISIPETIEVITDPEEVVALVTAPRSEEELEAELAEDKEAEAAAVEELGKEGAEETETAEGETPEGEQPEAAAEEKTE